MTFANPWAWLWGLLAVPVVILYLRRTRLRREPVATGMLWERVFAERPSHRWGIPMSHRMGRPAWQRWRHPASLALQLSVLALLVAALADPQIPGSRRMVLIVDNSASMEATDVKPKRLAEAKRIAARLIAGVRRCDRMAILSAGGAVGVCSSLTNDRTVLQEAVEKIEIPAAQGSTQIHAAVGLARRMLAETPRGEIRVISDGCFNGVAELAEAGDVKLIRVGKRTGNLAITRLQVRQPGPPPWLLLVASGVLLLILEWCLYQRRWIC